MNILNRNRLYSNNNRIIVAIAIFSVSIMGTAAAFFPFNQIPVSAQQQENNSNPKISLSTVSTAIGTGAAATGAIVTVPGFLSTRKQSKYFSAYLLEIHEKYNEFYKKGKPANKKEYLDFLNDLRRDIIYLLQRRHINENQYKMLDDRITEYVK